MTIFTIDEQNNMTAFASPEEAASTTQTPFDSFASETELETLIAGWPAERLVTTWNSLPGVAQEPAESQVREEPLGQTHLGAHSEFGCTRGPRS